MDEVERPLRDSAKARARWRKEQQIRDRLRAQDQAIAELREAVNDLGQSVVAIIKIIDRAAGVASGEIETEQPEIEVPGSGIVLP